MISMLTGVGQYDRADSTLHFTSNEFVINQEIIIITPTIIII